MMKKISFPRIGFITLSIVVLACSTVSTAFAWKVDQELGDGAVLNRTLAYPEATGVRIGNGWDYDLDQKTPGICVDFSPTSELFQKVESDISVVDDLEELRSMLNISASVEIKGLVAGGKASVEEKSDQESSTSTINVVVHVTATNGPTYAVPAGSLSLKNQTSQEKSGGISASVKPGTIQLTTEMLALLNAKNYDLFKKECGDGFVSTINTGAELYALLTFQDVTQKERTDIEAKLTTNGLFGTSSATADGKSIIDVFAEKKRLHINLIKMGGLGDPNPIDKDTLMKAVQDVPGSASRGPYPFAIRVQSYATLPNWPSSIGPPSVGDEENIVRAYLRLLTLHNELSFMIQNFGLAHDQQQDKDKYFNTIHYVFTQLGTVSEVTATERTLRDVPSLIEIQDLIYAKLDKLQRLASTCRQVRTDKHNANKASLNHPCKATRKDLDDFDDLPIRALLPIPVNVLDAENNIMDGNLIKAYQAWIKSGDQQESNSAMVGLPYAIVAYRYWIDNISRKRCLEERECKSNKDMEVYKDLVRKQFPICRSASGEGKRCIY